jgi:hypothetical protein
MSARYQYRSVWRVAGSLEEVKAVLGDAASLPRWWPSVYLDVEPVRAGCDDGVGRELQLFTKGWLPYTLRWTLRITEPITDMGFALTASGDLEGRGRWTFTPDGPETVISYDWQVMADKPLLRRLSWLLGPVFAANHRWAMARGEESLALELRRRRATGPDRRALVPAPPPPTFRRGTRRPRLSAVRRSRGAGPDRGGSLMRSFDPRLVGSLECQTWVAYYRREWAEFLRAAVRVVRASFGLSWPRTVLGAWWVLRANQHWAPFPNNRPEQARRCMRRFYRIVARANREPFDVDRAAELELRWWRAHRDLQRGPDPGSAAGEALVIALQTLYGHVYGVPQQDVRTAAEERAGAMTLSDRWVAEGADPSSALIPQEKAALIRSYTALLPAVQTRA